MTDQNKTNKQLIEELQNLRKTVKTYESDLSKHKKSEEIEHAKVQRHQEILNTIQEGYYEADNAGRFTFFNDNLCRILGYSKEEVFGLNYQQYLDDEDAKKVFQAFNAVYSTGKPVKIMDFELIRQDGTRKFVDISVSPIRDSIGQTNGFRGIVRDISNRKRIEQEKITREKLQGIIEIAGATSHELNQPLQSVSLACQFLLSNMKDDDPLYKIAKQMMTDVNRMSKITDNLGHITRYETKEYIEGQKIIDIGKASKK